MKRPLVLVCVLLAAVIAVCFGFFPGNADLFKKNEDLNRYLGTVITAEGTVKSYEEKNGYAVLVMRRTFFSVRENGKEVRYSLHTVRTALDPGKGAGNGTPVYCRAGETVKVRGRLTASAFPSNPGQFDEAKYDRLHHISCRIKSAVLLFQNGKQSVLPETAAVLRRFLFERLCEVYPDDTEEVLGAMLLGRKENLSYSLSRRYESGGISHMLVISSLHLSILSSLVYGTLRKCGCSVKGSAIAGGGVLLCFVCLTGCSVSSLRAVIFYLASMGARTAGRTYDRLNAAALAAILILAADPYFLFHSSFQLSFAAALLCMLSEKKGKTAGCVIIQFGMMPLAAWHFFEIPVLGVPVNLLLLPLLPVILITGAAGLVLGGKCVFPAVWCVRLYDRILGLIAESPDHLRIFGKWEIPFPTVFITGRPGIVMIAGYYVLFALFLYFLYRFRNRAKKILAYLFLPAMLLVLGLRIPGKMSVTFLDVGQGDGIVAESPNGRSILIDGGSSSVRDVGTYRILPFLKYSGIQRLDVIAVTHADSDHMNGVMEILALIAGHETALRAKYLLLPNAAEVLMEEEGYLSVETAARQAGLEVIKVKRGDSFCLDGMEVRILGPEPSAGQPEADANAQCIVMALKYGRLDVLLTGDVSGEGEEALTELVQREAHQYEILKVSHHGSKYSTPQAFLSAVSPAVSVISAGTGNRYGHPHKETMDRLAECGTAVFRTSRSGAVTVRTDGSSCTVETFLNTPAEPDRY